MKILNLFAIQCLLLLLLTTCQNKGEENINEIELLNVLNQKYLIVGLDTTNLQNCISENIVFTYHNKKGKVIKANWDLYLISVDNPVKEQEQGLIQACNLPEKYYIDGLEIYFDGKLGSNPAINKEIKPGAFISIDGQQRIYLTGLYIKK